MDLVWLVCLRPMGCHLLNFFEISGREFRSSAAKLRPKDNIGKLQRRPVFVSAFDAPVRRCAGKTSFFAPAYLLPSVLSLLSILFLLSILDGNINSDAKREKSPNRPGPRAGASASCRCESSGKSGHAHANMQKQCRWLCV